jgi:phospholipid/cholesterol/gamma-HCH transport system substrate-binding protein
MEPRAPYLAVGIFMLTIAAVSILLLLWFSKLELEDNQNLYVIFFEGAVTGLRENEEVKFRGVPIGKVRRVSVSKTHPDTVRVVVSIRKRELIREDAVATIEAQGLTGYTFVQIKGSTTNSPILTIKKGQKYPIIPSKPSEIQSLFEETPKILENLNKVTQRILVLMDEQNLNNFKQSLAHIQKITQDLSEGPDGINQLSHSLKESFSKVEQAAADLSKTSQEVGQMIQENRPAFREFSSEGLPELSRLLKKAQRAIDAIGRVADDLDQGPTHFLNKNTKQGYRIE